MGRPKKQLDTKKKSGPACGFRPEMVETIRQAQFAAPMTIDQCAALLNVHRSTFCRWMNQFPELREASLAAQDARDMVDIEQAVVKAAKGHWAGDKYFPPDMQAARFYLTNRVANRWSNKEQPAQQATAIQIVVQAPDQATSDTKPAEIVDSEPISEAENEPVVQQQAFAIEIERPSDD